MIREADQDGKSYILFWIQNSLYCFALDTVPKLMNIIYTLFILVYETVCYRHSIKTFLFSHWIHFSLNSCPFVLILSINFHEI